MNNSVQRSGSDPESRMARERFDLAIQFSRKRHVRQPLFSSVHRTIGRKLDVVF